MRALRQSCSSPRPSCPTRVEPNSPCVTEPLRVAAILEILPSPSALRRAAESHRPIEGGLEDHSPDIFLSPPFRSAPRAEVAKESPLTPPWRAQDAIQSSKPFRSGSLSRSTSFEVDRLVYRRTGQSPPWRVVAGVARSRNGFTGPEDRGEIGTLVASGPVTALNHGFAIAWHLWIEMTLTQRFREANWTRGTLAGMAASKQWVPVNSQPEQPCRRDRPRDGGY